MYNRGINTPREQKEWLEAGWDKIYDWIELDQENMKKACLTLFKCIQNDKKIQIVVDSDQDGVASGALLYNYLYSRFPDWVEQNLSYLIHTGKQHGLADVMDKIDCDLVICPDASSNDYKEHQELHNKGIECICLDHHPVDNPNLIGSDPAIIINVQLTEYPNKALTGGGVTYKFVSAFEDIVRHGNQPTEFMDLCAIANCGDMADYREPEIRAIIKIGFSNIKNPMLHEMVKQHSYVIEKRNGLNYLSAAFGIVPFTNAICRSATMEEKELFFKGMLTRYAFDKVPSSKRGVTGDVYLYQEAVTIADRVKRRQDKLVQETMEVLDKRIQDNHLTDNAIIVCLCEPDEIEAEICGLAANRIQAKYQHPTLVLRRTKTKNDKEYFYRGSGRNYSYCSIGNMRQLCESTGLVEYAQGQIVAL